MATLGDVQTWVGTQKLKRTDINSVILDFAQEAYFTICSTVPFPNLEKRTSELPIVADDDFLDISTVADLCGIMSVMLLKAGERMRRLTQRNGRFMDSLVRKRAGHPALYCRWGEKLEFDSAPSASDLTIILRYWAYPTLASPVGNTTLVFPPEWLELLKWETLYRTYMFLENWNAAQQLIMPAMLPRYPATKKIRTQEVGIIPRLWNDLLSSATGKDAYDSDYSINPIRRNYTG